jgi:hypothetical protein
VRTRDRAREIVDFFVRGGRAADAIEGSIDCAMVRRSGKVPVLTVFLRALRERDPRGPSGKNYRGKEKATGEEKLPG